MSYDRSPTNYRPVATKKSGDHRQPLPTKSSRRSVADRSAIGRRSVVRPVAGCRSPTFLKTDRRLLVGRLANGRQLLGDLSATISNWSPIGCRCSYGAWQSFKDYYRGIDTGHVTGGGTGVSSESWWASRSVGSHNWGSPLSASISKAKACLVMVIRLPSLIFIWALLPLSPSLKHPWVWLHLQLPPWAVNKRTVRRTFG